MTDDELRRLVREELKAPLPTRLLPGKGDSSHRRTACSSHRVTSLNSGRLNTKAAVALV
jgi:hypothetical protein